jgi:putative DNA primase/helicase
VTHNLASTEIITAALTWYDAGCSVIPIRADGTKKPVFEWKQAQHERIDRVGTGSYFRNNPGVGIGIICGKVSGHLEMLELEGRACNGDVLDRIITACGDDTTFAELLSHGYCEWTPSGGLHFLYRISDHDVPGNTKVARRPATAEEIAADMARTGLPIDKINKVKVLAETRGEGGYVVVAPSGGTVHATGDSWSVAAGAIGIIPTITWQQRQTLVQAITAVLDEMPSQPEFQPRPAPASLLTPKGDRPGDHFNAKADWADILQPHGWTISHTQGHTTYWVRPGKTARDGHSATTGRAADGDRLYVFSSSTHFTPETPYDKFAAWTLLEHGGDFTTAARTLRAQGYGSPTPSSLAAPVPAPLVADVPRPETALDTAAPSAAATPAAPAATTQVAVRSPWRYDWGRPAITGNAMIAGPATNLAAGELYAEAYEQAFKYCAEQKRWSFFNGKVWTEDLRDRHEQAAVHLIAEATKAADAHDAEDWKKWARTAARAATPANISRWARVDPRIAVDCASFDNQRHLITLDNGTYDLDADTFTAAHDPDLLLTKMLPVKYDKDATSPEWDTFLETVMPDEAMRGYLQRAVGHTLLGDAQERALFLLHGDSGTGKSQVIRVLELLFGDYAETADPTTFNEQSKRASVSNGLNDLRGKRFVSLSELEENERLNESLVKRLTGGDTAKSRGLYQENRQWQVQFTLWMATNYLPRLNSDDAAMWRRVKPIKFPTVVAEQGREIKKYGEKLFAKEAAGILNWALQGVRMYLADGLDDLQQITEAVATYRRDVDTVAQFTDAAKEDGLLMFDTHHRIQSRALHHIYQNWCERERIKPMGERRFGQRLESLGFTRHRTNTGAMWSGIGTGAWIASQGWVGH